ncbi:hypothetical protein P3S67_022515 [Capsicum chacoense]
MVERGDDNQNWLMDSSCSRHMTGRVDCFLFLKALQGGGMSFGNVKKGYIQGIGKIGKSPHHVIEDVYYVSGLKYSLLSVSQICDKGNKVKFSSDECTVPSMKSGKTILKAKRIKNMYLADLESVADGELTCLSAQGEDANLWHRRLGHVSSFLLNRLISRDLVRGLPKLKFSDNNLCDTCVKVKQTRSSFKLKNK